MPQVKKRFFKRSKKEDVTEKEKSAVEKIKKGGVAFTKVQRPHFPKNPRLIPELQGSFSFKYVIIGILVVLGLLLDGWVGVTVYKTFVLWSVLMSQRQKLYNELATWENITTQYPNYRDAYVEGALIAYRLGDSGKEQYFLQNLELLDPNFPLTKSLLKLEQLQRINK